MIALLVLQFALSVSFASNRYMISCLLTSMLFILTTLLVLKIANPIFEDEEIDDHKIGLRENVKENLSKWNQAYSHPLLVSNNELVIPRNERRVSLIIRN